MLVTEEEAKKKDCYQWIDDIQRNGFDHTFQHNVYKPLCNASSCMAWRWDAYKNRENHSELGYCGRAGKPE